MPYNSNKLVKVLSAGMVGFSFFWLMSHPKSKIKRKLPEKGYKKLILFPNVRYSKEDSFYQLHHWLLLSICYIPLLTSRRFRKSHIFHGIFLGSIFQGLLYKDRFKFSYPKKVNEKWI